MKAARPRRKPIAVEPRLLQQKKVVRRIRARNKIESGKGLSLASGTIKCHHHELGGQAHSVTMLAPGTMVTLLATCRAFILAGQLGSEDL